MHRVPVEIRQARNRPVAERRVLLDHRFDRGQPMFLNFLLGLGWPATHCFAGYLEPLAKLADRDGEPVFLQAFADRLVYCSSSPYRDCNFFRTRSSSIASLYASCRAFSWRSYCSRTLWGLARSAFFIALFAVIDPVFDLRWRQVVGPTGVATGALP
jgi:hypothetical protein